MKFDAFRAISLVNSIEGSYRDLWLMPDELHEDRASVVSEQATLAFSGPPIRVLLARSVPVEEAQRHYAQALSWAISTKFVEQPLARNALAQSQQVQSIEQEQAQACWQGELFPWPVSLREMFEHVQATLPLAQQRVQWGQPDKLAVAALILAEASLSKGEGIGEWQPLFCAPNGELDMPARLLERLQSEARGWLRPTLSSATLEALDAQPVPDLAWRGLVRRMVSLCSTEWAALVR